jgi:hypothetical protein
MARVAVLPARTAVPWGGPYLARSRATLREIVGPDAG